MDSLLADAEAERVASTLTDARLKHYMAEILRAQGFQPLDKHGNLMQNGAPTLVAQAPAANNAFVVSEDEVVPHLETFFSARETQGWTRPSVCIIIEVDGVRRARCVLSLPVAPPAQDAETIIVRSLRGSPRLFSFCHQYTEAQTRTKFHGVL
ncbi:hypothetical protein B0H16DRAFT_1856369 [Mycena metata]|uniref:Uncharacterized protein n=1 Tax=Mycena metata TaxID=1033252 RepID=A0AAD7INJ3_9AGAR|nr:hypothetical protein B0H16DRAFT_1856369 [Mycena metata]